MSDAPKITLHWLEKSRSQRILWLLEELGVPYEIKTYKRDPKTMLAPPELKTIHPLGKAPVITVGDRTIAESGLIIEYLCEHFGGPNSTLIPRKWKDGCEGQIGGETEEFMRYRYYMHYAEGSLMTLITLAFIPWSERILFIIIHCVTHHTKASETHQSRSSCARSRRASRRGSVRRSSIRGSRRTWGSSRGNSPLRPTAGRTSAARTSPVRTS